MRTRLGTTLPAPGRAQRGYLIVLVAVILAFLGVAAAMQVLVLTSVGTTSRAFDTYRQSATEVTRLQRVVVEAMLDHRQVSVVPASSSLQGPLSVRLSQLSAEGATVQATRVPGTLPPVVTFPAYGAAPDPLVPRPRELERLLTPELALLAGSKLAVYPEVQFEFASERTVLEVVRTYRSRVRAQLLAVPLTRFPIAAYDLPAEIGATGTAVRGGAGSTLPAGLVPARDGSFLTDLQAQPGVLPYHYRRRAALAAAYQYVFSQSFIDRVAEYAGITHYHNLDAVSGTADLAGMTKAGGVTVWNLGLAGGGTHGSITLTNDAAVVFSGSGERTLRLHDSVGETGAPAMLLLVLGPADPAKGTLAVELGTIARPVVIIGYNVRVTAAAGVALNGALLLDPASVLAPAGTLTVGHLSYWAGSTSVPAQVVVTTLLPDSAELIAPRVVYVASVAQPI